MYDLFIEPGFKQILNLKYLMTNFPLNFNNLILRLLSYVNETNVYDTFG